MWERQVFTESQNGSCWKEPLGITSFNFPAQGNNQGHLKSVEFCENRKVEVRLQNKSVMGVEQI